MNSSGIYLRFIIFTAILFWCTGFTFSAFSNGSPVSIAATPIFNLFYNNVCHQDGNKLISLNGFSFLICSRCSGIYFGALFSSLILLLPFKINNISKKIFYIASFFLLTDVTLNNFLFSSYNKATAFATGLFFGFVCLSVFIYQIESHILAKTKNDFF